MNSAKALFLALLFLTAACASVPFPDPEEPPFFATVEVILATRTAEVEVGISTPVPTLAPGCMAEIVDGVFQDIVCEATAEPTPQRTNWLLLGGDNRAHRKGTGWGNKTDVIVLVSVLETDPVEISVIQFPRNLYVPTSLGDIWLFSVWDEGGWQGLHQYFQEAFGVALQGIFYVDMDGFVKLVNGLDGIRVQVVPTGFKTMYGEQALAYLRDNENNWGRGSYDAGRRALKVTEALIFAGWAYIQEDPIVGMNYLLGEYGALIQSDLSNVKQFYWLAEMAVRISTTRKHLGWVQLEEPRIVRGDTPIMQNEQPMRGMIANTDLKEWMRNCVFNWVDDGSCK